MISFVKGGVREGDGKSVELFANEAFGQGGDERGVEAATEVGADGDVREEAQASGVGEETPEFVEIGGVGGRAGVVELLESGRVDGWTGGRADTAAVSIGRSALPPKSGCHQRWS